MLLIIDSSGSETCRVRATRGAFVKLIFYLENLHKKSLFENFILLAVMRLMWLDSSLVLLLCANC
jgi:hypothetical protein